MISCQGREPEMIPIIIQQEDGSRGPGLVAVHAVPRAGEIIIWDGKQYDVLNIEHLLTDIIVKIAPHISGRKTWR